MFSKVFDEVIKAQQRLQEAERGLYERREPELMGLMRALYDDAKDKYQQALTSAIDALTQELETLN